MVSLIHVKINTLRGGGAVVPKSRHTSCKRQRLCCASPLMALVVLNARRVGWQAAKLLRGLKWIGGRGRGERNKACYAYFARVFTTSPKASQPPGAITLFLTA